MKWLLTTWMIVAGTIFLNGQNTAPSYRASAGFDDQIRADERFRIVFYNVENLFDTNDDSLTRDEEFTPMGRNHHTWEKFKKKSDDIARCLVAIGGWEPAELIGLCEIENRAVLEGLIQYSLLDDEYEIIHEDSRDFRGIDVAAIYRPKKFNVIYYEYFPIDYPDDTTFTSRDILYIQGIVPNKDTIHTFFNHWPSRYGGQFRSEPFRIAAAKTLRERVDRILEKDADANIIIAGDFNDEPSDYSVSKILKAAPPEQSPKPQQLYNLMAPVQHHFGTHHFSGEWGVLDQVIVSSSLLDETNNLNIVNNTAVIFDMPFLLKPDASGKAVPFRTYQGPMYIGGFSDHLPVYIDLQVK